LNLPSRNTGRVKVDAGIGLLKARRRFHHLAFAQRRQGVFNIHYGPAQGNNTI
jgi:hypothetical protein